MPIDAFAAERLSVGVPAEVDLVGLAFGVRPELTWRPLGGVGAVRVATGVMAGPELVFVPVSGSLRARLGREWAVHPVLGAGAELQLFATSGHPLVARRAWLFELGVDVDVAERWSVGLVVEPNLGAGGNFGFGTAVRAGVTRHLGR